MSKDSMNPNETYTEAEDAFLEELRNLEFLEAGELLASSDEISSQYLQSNTAVPYSMNSSIDFNQGGNGIAVNLNYNTSEQLVSKSANAIFKENYPGTCDPQSSLNNSDQGTNRSIVFSYSQNQKENSDSQHQSTSDRAHLLFTGTHSRSSLYSSSKGGSSNTAQCNSQNQNSVSDPAFLPSVGVHSQSSLYGDNTSINNVQVCSRNKNATSDLTHSLSEEVNSLSPLNNSNPGTIVDTVPSCSQNILRFTDSNNTFKQSEDSNSSVSKENSAETNVNNSEATNNISNSQVIRCKFCGLVSSSETGIQIHEAMRHKKKQDCTCCGHKFLHVKQYAQHRLLHHTPASMLPFKCCHCKVSFKLFKHIAIHKTCKHSATECQSSCVTCHENFRNHYSFFRKCFYTFYNIQLKQEALPSQNILK